jgi:excisionase family DNA binding protein
METDERWVTLPEAARATGISLDTWRRWCQRGRVPHTTVFGKHTLARRCRAIGYQAHQGRIH